MGIGVEMNEAKAPVLVNECGKGLRDTHNPMRIWLAVSVELVENPMVEAGFADKKNRAQSEG